MKTLKTCIMLVLFASVATMAQAQQSAFQGTWIGERNAFLDHSGHRLEISGSSWSLFIRGEIQAAGTAVFSSGRAQLLLANGDVYFDFTLLAPGRITQPPGSWTPRFNFRRL